MLRDVVHGQMQSTRREILTILKKRGGMTADALSAVLGITPMGVRRHLTLLEKDSLVVFRPVQRGVGRPCYVYSLTAAADELFPRNYPRLTADLLDAVVAIDGPAKVEALFAARAEWLAEQYRPRLAGKDLAGQVAELTRIQDENGYLADWEALADGTFRLKEYNCTISQVARRYRQVCVYELALFHNLLDAEVVREKHMASGDEGCVYHIRSKT
jgi:predicted ArsR family transcriptional regulator